MFDLSLEKILFTVTALALFCSVTTASFAENGTAKIIILSSSNSKAYVELIDGFKKQLEKDGVGANYRVVLLQDKTASSDDVLHQVEQENPNLIISLGSRALKWVDKHRPSKPIVASMVLDIDNKDDSLDMAGVVLDFSLQTQLHWIMRAMPEAKRVGIIYNPLENHEKVELAQQYAKRLGLEIIARPIKAPKDLPTALKEMARHADVVWGLSDNMVTGPKTARVVLLSCFRNRVPYFGLSASWVKAGALFGLDRDYADIGAQVAEKALIALQGRSLTTLPLAVPRKEKYLINLKIARHLKMEFSKDLLEGASETY